MHLLSEPRFCFRENQNKEEGPFSKVASSGELLCNASWWQELLRA